MLNNLRTRFGKEELTNPGIENWTGDTPDDWPKTGESPGVRDIIKESIEIHGGSAAAKFEATDNDGSGFSIIQTVTLSANRYYAISGWIYFPTRTAGNSQMFLYNSTDTHLGRTIVTAINVAYVYYELIDKPTVPLSYFHCQFFGETTTGIVYFDDLSVKELLPHHLGS